MIASFFQSLNARGVEYLLISGQATVLYGAATFSEDIDLWINPTEENRDRLVATLRDCAARYYKYWRGIIGEFKASRSAGKLMPEGAEVSL